MNFFKKLFATKSAQNVVAVHDRYPENVQGDFYVENDVCTSCGALQAEAPDLIDHSRARYGHCYFKKQPETKDELYRAINAMAVSCVDGLRYAGRDEKILKWLYEMDLGYLCDNEPVGNYRPLIRSRVVFKYAGTIKELSGNITDKISSVRYYKLSKFVTNDIDRFEFIISISWREGLTGTICKCKLISDNLWEIKMTKEKDGAIPSIRGNAYEIDNILKECEKASEIMWFDMNRSNKIGNTTPY